MAENTVRIDSSTPVSITGTVVATSTNSTTAFTTLSAATTGTGAVVDYGSAQNDLTMAIIVSGTITGGTVALDVSQDGTNFIQFSTGNPTTGTNSKLTASNEAWRYARGRVSTNITGGGNVTLTIMSGS